MNAVSVLTPSVVCFILWAIQTANRPPTPLIIFDSEKICGTGEVYLTISKHKTRTDVRTKLNFPFCAFTFMRFWLWNCQLETKKAVGNVGTGEWWLFLFFDFFLATLERNHSYCLLKVFILIFILIIIKLKLLLDKKWLMWYFIYNIYNIIYNIYNKQ